MTDDCLQAGVVCTNKDKAEHLKNFFCPAECGGVLYASSFYDKTETVSI